jgi:hypothetical protein
MATRTLLKATLACVVALLALDMQVFAKDRTPPPPPPPAYLIIVHARNPATSLRADFLQDAFLKKKTRWPNDVVIRPTDLTTHAPARVRFSEEVLGRPVAAVRSYWEQRIFSGRDVPPPEMESDAAVVAYVLKHEGAIGYVSATAELGGAKVVTVAR